MQWYKKIAFLFLAIPIAKVAHSQNDFTLYQMKAVPQVTTVNPAAVPLSRGFVGLPVISGIYLNVGNNGFRYNDVVQLDGDSLNLNFEEAIDRMQDQNQLSTYFRTDLFSFGFRVGNNYFSFNATEKIDFRFNYPKQLFEFLWEGNASETFLGNRASFDGLGVDFLHYRQFGFGYARRLSAALTVGARFNYLYGQEAVYTESSEIGVTTGEEIYALTADAAFDIRTAGLTDESFNGFDDPMNYLTQRKNTGYSFDFGAEYNFFDLFSINAAVIDLGSITWQDQVKRYTLDKQTVTFEGLDLFDLIDPLDDQAGNEPNTDLITNLADSIVNQFTNIEESETSFKTPLNTQIYLGANYNITNRIKVGVLTRNQFTKGERQTSASLALSGTFGNFFSASMNYSVHGRSAGNIGTGISVNLGPLQLYTITDNVLAAIQWYQVKNVHLRFGLNLTFGRDYEF